MAIVTARLGKTYLVFGPDELAKCDLKTGDTILWEFHADGSAGFKKINPDHVCVIEEVEE